MRCIDMNIRTVDNHCHILLQTGPHEFRPRSMDGVIDSGVSLNGDTSSCPDTNLHTQNQQVSKEYILYTHREVCGEQEFWKMFK